MTRPPSAGQSRLADLFSKLQLHGRVLVIVDQPNTIGALPIAVARSMDIRVANLLAMRRIADLHLGTAKTDARDASSRVGWTWVSSPRIPDADFSEVEGGGMLGEPTITCELTSRPDARETADLLDAAAASASQIIEWSKTPVGKTLAGTSFAVTERHSTRRR